MDNAQAGYLLIGATMIILVGFLFILLLVMIIYRKRKMEHLVEMQALNEKYHKEMLETQVEIQKDTMQQIGRDIHDNVGQKLTLAALYTEHLKLEGNKPPSVEKITNITALINESLNDLRELSRSLTHPPETAAGLDVLLQKEVIKLNQAEICSAHFESTGKPVDLSLKVNSMLLRIVQEFLHNSIRHAACNNIYVRIAYNAAGVGLQLSDDGKGFDVAATGTGAGIGLDNMRKRAGLIGADILLKSSLGYGTTLELFIPVANIN